jgi:cytidine deaminase
VLGSVALFLFVAPVDDAKLRLLKHPHSEKKNRELSIVSPCGMCRELMYDYAPDCYVILETDQEIVKQR